MRYSFHVDVYYRSEFGDYWTPIEDGPLKDWRSWNITKEDCDKLAVFFLGNYNCKVLVMSYEIYHKDAKVFAEADAMAGDRALRWKEMADATV